MMERINEILRHTAIGEGIEPYEHATAIRRKLGNMADVVERFTPARQDYCTTNFDKCTTVPEICRVARTYGETDTMMFIQAHVAYTLLRMSDTDIDRTDKLTICKTLLADARIRVLKLTSFMALLHKVGSGEVEIYGKLTPYKFMQAVWKLYPFVMDKQYQAERQKEQAERQAKEATEEHITYEEYCRRNGNKGNEIIEQILNQKKK